LYKIKKIQFLGSKAVQV